MRLLKREVVVPPGQIAVVNLQVVEKRPLYVGKEAAVHLVSLSPWINKFTANAACRQHVPVSLTVTGLVELPGDDLSTVLKHAGYGNYKSSMKVSAATVADQQSLSVLLNAALETFIRTNDFFVLIGNAADTQSRINQLFREICARAKLCGEVVSVESGALEPGEKLLAKLASEAGMVETASGGVRHRQYEKNPDLGAVVEYFLEANRQEELLKAQESLAKAEGERTVVEAQQQMIETRNDLKIKELEEEHRRGKRKAELDVIEAQWGEEAMKRNATIKERNAEYETLYKQRRAKDDMDLARMANELAAMKEEQSKLERERKRADIEQVEVFREEILAKVRREEIAALVSEINSLLDHFKEVPVRDYHGVHTLVLSDSNHQDPVKDLLTVLLSRFTEIASNSKHPPVVLTRNRADS